MGALINPTVELLRDRLLSALAPRRIILFGSRARGTAQPASDYDILVVAQTDRPFDDPGGLRCVLRREVDESPWSRL